jgi:hypothetical protein
MASQAPMNRIARLIPPSTAKLVTMKSGTPSATARRRSGTWLENGMIECWRSARISSKVATGSS